MRNAVRAVIVVAVGLGSLPAATPATSAGTVAAEIGMAVFLEGSAAFFGYNIIRTGFPRPGGPSPEYYDTVVTINPVGVVIGLSLFAAYPLAAAMGTYFLGEKVDGPAANKGAAFGYTTLAAYGQTLFLALGASTVGATEGTTRSETFEWAFWVDAATKPVLTTYVYHKVKKPAAPAEESRLAVDPYFCNATTSDGGAVPLYGLTLSF